MGQQNLLYSRSEGVKGWDWWSRINKHTSVVLWIYCVPSCIDWVSPVVVYSAGVKGPLGVRIRHSLQIYSLPTLGRYISIPTDASLAAQGRSGQCRLRRTLRRRALVVSRFRPGGCDATNWCQKWDCVGIIYVSFVLGNARGGVHCTPGIFRCTYYLVID